MKTTLLACLALLLGTVILSAPLLAHHGNSAYDLGKTVTVTGTVTKWQVINPHSGIWIEVKDAQGNVQVWSGEFGGALDLYRRLRWNKDTFKLGDQVTLTGNPAKNGSYAIYTRKVILPSGKEADMSGT